MEYWFIQFTLLIIILINSGDALKCYTCTYVSTSSSKACINDPEKVEGQKITNCNKKYCTIQRQELTDPPGFINSFLRGCEDAPMNDVVEDFTFKTYLRSCNTELCNNGDGITSGGTGVNPDGNENAENLMVPGLSSYSNKLYCTSMLLHIVSMIVAFKNL